MHRSTAPRRRTLLPLLAGALVATVSLWAQDATPSAKGPRELFADARAAAGAGDDAAALDLLEQVVAAGGTPFAATLRAAEFLHLHEVDRFKAIVESMRPCREPERRHFDFWIGEWDVANPQGGAVGQNVIRPLDNGCGLHESYIAGNFTGMSFNFWDPNTRRWHQTWIDNQGQPLFLDGELVDGKMVLSGTAASALQRVTWTPLDDGRVRQHWERSNDQGATWTTAFDGYYSRRE